MQIGRWGSVYILATENVHLQVTRFCGFKIKGGWERATRRTRTKGAHVRAISHACAFHCSSSTRTRLPYICTRSLGPRPPRPKWTCTCTHGFWCGAWSEVITLLTVMMFNLKGWWSTCTSQDGTGPVLLPQHIRLQKSSNFSRKPHLQVNSRSGSDIQPVNNRDPKITAPLGAIYTYKGF